MNKEELEKNILILKNSQKIDDLFLCIRYLIELNDENKFNEFIEEKKSALLKADPIKFIGYHIDFYVCHERYLESLNLLHFYQEAPFISLDVDDFLKDLEKEIKEISSPKKVNSYQIENLKKDLYSSNEDKIMCAIKFLDESNVRNYLSLIKEFLKSNANYNYKVLIEFVLVSQKIDEVILIKNRENKLFEFNPSKNVLPFEKSKFIEATNYLNKLNENPTDIFYALEFLKQIEIKSYPHSIFEKENVYSICEIIIYMVKDSLKENPSMEKLKHDIQMDEVEIKQIIDFINSSF